MTDTTDQGSRGYPRESLHARLLSTGVIYAIAAIAQRGLGFFMLPIYLRVLVPNEVGQLSLLTLFSQFLFGTLAIGLPSAILKCYHRDCESEEEQQRLLATTLALGMPIIAAGTVLVWLAAEPISGFLLQNSGLSELIRIAASTGFFSGAVALVLAFVRAQERAVAYGIGTITQFLIALLLNITFVVYLGFGVRGVLLSNLISNAAVLPLVLWMVRRSSELRLDSKLFRPLLAFGVKLVPTFFAMFTIDLSDRYFLSRYDTIAQAGIYDVGYKIGMIVQLGIVWPFQLAWPAFAFGISRDDRHRQSYRQTMSYLVAALAGVILGLTLVSRVGFETFATEAFASAYKVVPLIAIAYALNGVHYCAAPAIHIEGKTHYISLLAVVAALLNLGLNQLLIPRWGMLGASYATILAFGLLAVGSIFVAERLHRVEYEYGRLVRAVVLAFLVFGIATFLPRTLTVVNVSLHLLLGLAYLGIVLSPAFLSAAERRSLLRFIVSRARAARSRGARADGRSDRG